MKGPRDTFCVKKYFKNKYLFLWIFAPGQKCTVPVSSNWHKKEQYF